MTRKKFVDALLDAITTYAGLDGQIDMETTAKFVDAKIGVFFGHIESDEGTQDIQHYMLIEFQDGSKWRIVPERVLKLEEHEQQLWDQLKEHEGEIPEEDDEEPEDE